MFWMCNFKTSALPLLEARERAGGGDVESMRCAMLRRAKGPERFTAVRQRHGKFGAVANFRIRV
jgi:hypothetical protein